ncbi:MAG: hypothetical protein KDA78_09010 [Planctomycetaceae bacterium]|nr:hypothetical protein [Planctomycetaceae bacterium]
MKNVKAEWRPFPIPSSPDELFREPFSRSGVSLLTSTDCLDYINTIT